MSVTFARLSDVLTSGELDGYQAGAPRWGHLPGMLEMDADVCESSTCPHCGHPGLEYRPFHSSSEHSYRAFAVCPKCEMAQEF